MKKFFIYFCAVGLLISTSFANKYENYEKIPRNNLNIDICTILFKEYDIDPEVRSPNGWQRIYKSGMLYDYLHIPISNISNKSNKNNIKILINCLMKNAFKIENYQRKIGDKKK